MRTRSQTTYVKRTSMRKKWVEKRKKRRRNVSFLFHLFLDVDHLRREWWASSSSVKHFFCVFFTFPHFFDRVCLLLFFCYLCFFAVETVEMRAINCGLNTWKISINWIIFEIERNTGYIELTFFFSDKRSSWHEKNALKSSNSIGRKFVWA